MINSWHKYSLSDPIRLKLRQLVQILFSDELNRLLGMSFKFDFD